MYNLDWGGPSGGLCIVTVLAEGRRVSGAAVTASNGSRSRTGRTNSNGEVTFFGSTLGISISASYNGQRMSGGCFSIFSFGPPTSSYTYTVTVRDCATNVGLSGVSVSINNGGRDGVPYDSASGRTNSSGSVSLSLKAASSGYASASASIRKYLADGYYIASSRFSISNSGSRTYPLCYHKASKNEDKNAGGCNAHGAFHTFGEGKVSGSYQHADTYR